jgi:hypothetical protein
MLMGKVDNITGALCQEEFQKTFLPLAKGLYPHHYSEDG